MNKNEFTRKPTREMIRRYVKGLEKTQSSGKRPGAVMIRQRERSSQVTVNLTELLVRVDNDQDLLCELIGIFKQEFPRLLQSLQHFVVCGDMKNVEGTSHALKGMLSGLSVTRAAALAAGLEQMARDGKTSGLIDALTILENEVVDLLPELDACAGKAKP